MNDIISKREEIWNKKLGTCIKNAGYTSQKAFIDDFNKKYGTKCTQKDVSRWLHVGDIKTSKCNSNTKTDEKIGFPSYSNMIRIANFFNVDVGFLTGETEYNSFTLEAACKYLHLKQNTVEFLRLATSIDTAFKTTRCPAYETQTVLDKFITANSFPNFIQKFISLNNEYNGPDKKNNVWLNLEREFGFELLQKGFEIISSPDPDIDFSAEPELLAVTKQINRAIDDCYDINTNQEFYIDVLRYYLQQAFADLINELYPNK